MLVGKLTHQHPKPVGAKAVCAVGFLLVAETELNVVWSLYAAIFFLAFNLEFTYGKHCYTLSLALAPVGCYSTGSSPQRVNVGRVHTVKQTLKGNNLIVAGDFATQTCHVIIEVGGVTRTQRVQTAGRECHQGIAETNLLPVIADKYGVAELVFYLLGLTVRVT